MRVCAAPPSRGDGKPVGTPMDAKSPFHAGVTMGPDQVERMEEARRVRNRLRKLAAKARHRANVAALSPEESRKSWQDYKFRRKRGLNMFQALKRGTKVAKVASYWKITPDDVLAEVKWWTENRNRVRKRHGHYDQTVPSGLPVPRENTRKTL